MGGDSREAPVPAAGAGTRVQERRSDTTEEPARARASLVRRAVGNWRRQLIDTSGNNRLLSYRDMRVGTLNLTPRGEAGARPNAVDALLRGEPTLLSEIYPSGDRFEDARRRVSNIAQKAAIVREEKGLDSLFVALGLARWRPPDRGRPNAPVLLVPVSAEVTGGSTDDHLLTRTGDPILNPVLALVLRVEFKIRGLDRLVQAVLADADLSVAAARRLLDEIAAGCASLPGFTIAPRAVMGNFSYAAMPMVIDLEGNIDRLVVSDLVSSLAGDDDARQALAASRVDIGADRIDDLDPRDEVLVMDADSSQLEAVERVLGGESLVIQGPPGTGKSQTIVNMIAALAAAGKRILFVAEKRVAIESVHGRLQQLGLDDLVLDLRGGVGSRQRISEMVGASLEGDRSDGPPPPDVSELDVLRRRLREHVDELHRPLEPSGSSRFRVYECLLERQRGAARGTAMDGASAVSLTQERLAELTAAMQEWVRLGGSTFLEEYPEWGFLVGLPSERIDALRNALDEIGDRYLPAALTTLRHAADDVRLEHPTTLDGWTELLALLRGVTDFAAHHDPAIYRENLEATVLDLAPAREGPLTRFRAKLTSSRFRDAVQSVRSVSGGRRRTDELLEAASAAIEHKRQWVMRRRDGRLPRPPEGLAEAEQSMAVLLARLDGLAPEVDTAAWTSTPVDRLQAELDRLRTDPLIENIVRLAGLGADLRASGLEGVMAALAAGVIPDDAVEDAVAAAWLGGLLAARAESGESFDGEVHASIRREFGRLDRVHIADNRHRVVDAVRLRAARSLVRFPEQVDFLRDELTKNQTFVPARVLVDRAADVIGALRPCWMMSPLLVSEVLPPLTLFDVVIFDEASQVIPAEAIPALARARQMVVVGDRQQLPPTTFFTRTVMDEEAGDAAEEVPHFESILDAASEVTSEILLDRHYRSRDERLVSFSNAEIYGGALRTFPGPGGPDPIVHHVVPGPADSTGGTRSNPAEVERVVDLAVAQATERPGLSLGVVAMSQAHAQNIEQALRRRLAEIGSPELDEWFGSRRVEPFFVKNLERVQGDERDVVILSTGRHEPGEGALPLSFGPLLLAGGERRLNVAITRSRIALHVVTSFSAGDLVTERRVGAGVDLLRRFLESLGRPVPSRPPADVGPIVADIGSQLDQAGVPVELGLGRSGHRIDVAARHPEHPDRFVLAVLIDGEAYRAEPTVRDRDRLLDEWLERLGWRVHRIWVDDWMRDSRGATRRAVESWVEAVIASDTAASPGGDGA